jgi:hypothetical protein
MGEQFDLITRDVAIGTGALTGPLVVWRAAEDTLDATCVCGTAPSRASSADRVPASGRAAGEPAYSRTEGQPQ